MKCKAVQPRLVPQLLLVSVCVLGAGSVACAQPATPEMPPAGANDLIRESGLRVRLEDEDGALHPVPGFTLERFRELLALESRLKEQQDKLPQAIFTSPTEVKGRVDRTEKFAQLSVAFHFRLTGQAGVEQLNWTAIPLQLGNAFLDVQEISHDGQGELFVTRNNGAYVCWLQTMPDTSHTIRVPLKARIHETGSIKSVSLSLPDAATSIQLTIPKGKIQASSSDEQVSVSTEQQGTNSIVSVEGAGGQMEITWQPADEASSQTLEATAATTFYIHGNLVRSEARLAIRSRAEPIDSFVVVLPAELQVDATRDAEIQIVPLPSSKESEPQRVLVKRLAGKTTELIEVTLNATLPPIKVDKQRRVVELAGFRVEGSVREWGTVDVSVDGNWSPTWNVGQFVQRVAVPEGTKLDSQIAARFLYDRQPYSLSLELQPKLTQVALEASYEVTVSADNLQLDATINGSTNGADISSLPIQMAGWTVESIVDVATDVIKIDVNDSGLLSLPLDANTPEFEFHILARRETPVDATEVIVELPRSDLDSVQVAATLIVHASENLELTPDTTRMQWLAQETRTQSSDAVSDGNAPLVYREEFSAETKERARFVAFRRLLPRETSFDVTSVTTLGSEHISVQQSFKAVIAHEPLTELNIQIPNEVSLSDTLTITSGGEVLTLQPVAIDQTDEQPTAEPSSSTPPVHHSLATIILPEPVIGAMQVELYYEIAESAIQSAEGLRIPLIQPTLDESTTLASNLLTIRADDSTAVTVVDDGWASLPAEVANIGDSYELQLQAADVRMDAMLQTSIVENRPIGNRILTRAWIQSWITPSDRRDRVCYLLRSDEPSVQIRLPQTAQFDQLRVLVDGKAAAIATNRIERSLVVTLTDEQVGRDVCLELWYKTDTSEGSHIGVALPSVANATRAERVYWQIAMPRSEHLAWLPATLTPELVWRRDQLHWYRQGRLEQNELEQLVGASAQDALPTDTNRYLFSATGSVESVGFATVSRWKLLLIGSGATLAVLLPFVYIPSLRRPSILFVIGLMLFAVALTYPEYAVLTGQAGAIGLALGIVAYAMQRFIGRATTVPMPWHGSVHLPADSKVSVTTLRHIEGSSRATTATAPAHLQVARVEGES